MAHRTTLLWAVCVTAAITTLTACGSTAGARLASESPRQEVQVEEARALPGVVDAADSLGLRILRHAEPGNAVLSPAGAQVVLAMVAEGAGGEAAAQLDALLGAAGQDRTDAVNALLADLEPLDGDPALAAKDELPDRTLVHLANQVTVDDEAEIVPAYLDRLAAGYGAGLTGTDLGSAEGKKVLDQWVRKESGGLVEESAIEPDPLLRLVLQNALVVAARWERPFDANVTRDQDFTLQDGAVVQVPMMHQLAPRCYAEVEGWQAVRLAYEGGELVADLVLPPTGTSPEDLTEAQQAELLAMLDCGEGSVEVLLGLPKADVSTRVDLLPVLEESVPAITELGGLPGMSTEELYISQAVQQGVLKVDEEGTVAAVVTEMGAAAGSAPAQDPVTLTFDRPYLVRLATTSTGWPLVLARVDDPRAR